MRFRLLPVREVARRILILLVSPLLISLVAGILLAWSGGLLIGRWALALVALLVPSSVLLYLVSHTRYFDEYLLRRERSRRSRRFRRPRILVLDGRVRYGVGTPPQPLWSDRRVEEWAGELRGQNPNATVFVGSIIENLEPPTPDVVVNPFGEVYPEEEPGLYTTFAAIRRYVFCGGVYVNVAGHPFYYQHNPNSNTRAQAGRLGQPTAPNIYPWIPLLVDVLPSVTPDMLAPLTMELMQNTDERALFGDIAGAGGQITAMVFRAYDVQIAEMIPVLRSVDQSRIVIGAVPHGEGFFLFAGLSIARENTGFEKVIAAIKGWNEYERRGRVRA